MRTLGSRVDNIYQFYRGLLRCPPKRIGTVGMRGRLKETFLVLLGLGFFVKEIFYSRILFIERKRDIHLKVSEVMTSIDMQIGSDGNKVRKPSSSTPTSSSS